MATDTPEAPAAPPAEPAKGDCLGTGRRKSSVARVRVCTGEGKLEINGRELEDYFPNLKDQKAVISVLEECGVRSSVDVRVRVHGGGYTGQSGAVRLGLARALKNYRTDLEAPLRDAHMLTRDARMKERKKPGLHGARRGTQFSKR